MDSKPSDIELLEKVKNSDMDAFRLLFERYQPIIFRQLTYQTGEIDISQDIVQETFIRVWENRRSLKPHLSFLAFTFRISRNILYDFIKHQKVRERSAEFLPPTESSEHDDPLELLQANLLQEQISTIINTHLPPRCREIFLLSRFEGKTHREIASLLKLSVRTVEHQVNHALKVLRRKLKYDDLK